MMSKDESSHTKTIELATAVLMIEISLADDHIKDEERNVIKTVLSDHFKLSDEDINELIAWPKMRLIMPCPFMSSPGF